MKIYLYDKETKEFIKESLAYLNVEKSRESKETVWDIPKNATLIEPPNVNNSEVAIFNGSYWEILKDYRGLKVFDLKQKRKIIINEIGELPKDCVFLESKEYENFLNTTDTNRIRNNIKTLIENLYNKELDKDLLIGKHYFSIKDFNKYENIKLQVENKFKEINNKFNENQKIMNSNKNDVSLYNKLAEENLLLYKELDSIIINLVVKNKRKKEIELPCNYDEFSIIYGELKKVKSNIDKLRDKALVKLKLMDKQEKLLVYEIILLERGLNAETTNEESFKENF